MAWKRIKFRCLRNCGRKDFRRVRSPASWAEVVTRNAVIGKVHRMGFADRGLPSRGGNSGGRKSSPEAAAAAAAAAARGSGSAHKGSRAGSGKSAPSLPPPVPQLQPADEDVRVLDLADHNVAGRWVIRRIRTISDFAARAGFCRESLLRLSYACRLPALQPGFGGTG